MYLKGYRIKTTNNSKSVTLPKWDFGGDKPWTNTSWNKTLETIRGISKKEYPLIVLDLDNLDYSEVQLQDKSAFEEWLKEVMK
ncbi:hypothetical protein [Aquimarina brevivitae]|uniref:Uncharacterized protein n=1 Tax=Aquimarina brevivitae TaxID=323412 RepID=A0A4Q7NVZ4_9FLAO|nr:hypothetical protein [Aquimarina brevivitae]RZS90572.1 hypothetical protein EV197_3366 [Aquimarina brevivitae]